MSGNCSDRGRSTTGTPTAAGADGCSRRRQRAPTATGADEIALVRARSAVVGLGHESVKFGSRFSTKAAMPSV
ncbi:hypothetical protein [Brevibacterium metallidurans]|uniref:hypothetical protein n=1 Tax=Brevibacterium metallidurans TaxID=1482676 RepID=UPI0030DD4C64